MSRDSFSIECYGTFFLPFWNVSFMIHFVRLDFSDDRNIKVNIPIRPFPF